MKILKKILILGLIIILIYVMYQKMCKKENLIKIFGKAFLVVTTGSMEPNIKMGELIIISDKKEYEINDIVTYIDEDNNFITHRIVSENKELFITKGDSNNIQDSEIHVSQIQGKVIFHSRILGFFVLYLLKPFIFTYFIIVIILEIIRCYKHSKNNKISSPIS